jgi:sugar (pentulose or hexulose) kinase
MSRREYIWVIDVGTSSLKSAVVDRECRVKPKFRGLFHLDRGSFSQAEIPCNCLTKKRACECEAAEYKKT